MTAIPRQTLSINNKGNSLDEKTDGEATKVSDYYIENHDIILDLKVMMSDYYDVAFTEGEHFLQIKFNNGQNFKISVEPST